MSAELLAGRELDAMVHVRVMGLVGGPCPGTMTDAANGSAWSCDACAAYDDHGPFKHETVPRRYSTDIAAAWALIDKAFSDGVPAMVGLAWGFDGKARGYFCNWGGFTAHADTAPLAICRAALAAMGAA